MAHVLLPCDLPSWPDVQQHMAQLSACTDGHQVARVMTAIYDLCCVSLDPDDAQRGDEPHPGMSDFGRFVEEVMSEEERNRFLKETLPRMSSRAAELKRLKPAGGFLYSLRKEEGRFELERSLVASLLANAFFSTFPKRNSKTHPTLQDFRMADFFTHLNKRSHQKKLKAFLRYFETLDATPGGNVIFTRKVIQGPSLPGWLCSDRPLVPLVLRHEGTVHHAETHVYRACTCSQVIGGDVIKASTSKEARLFFSFPEILVILSFVEGLADEEALIAECAAGTQAGLCFLDLTDFSEDPSRQFEDRFLLRELNKALAALTYDKEEVNSRRASLTSKSQPVSRRGSEQARKGELRKKFSSQNSSKYSMKTASQTSVDPSSLKEENYYTADEDSDEGGGYTEETSISRSADSLGFVLGEDSGDEELPPHERLDDFRKRIRKRTRRRLSRRRSSNSSYAGTSSDMDDILEDPEPCLLTPCLRPASSEPSLVTPRDSLYTKSPLSEAAETVLVNLTGKKMMVTSSNGHLKAYSYDGVNPNLPVPFKARFRERRHKSVEASISIDRTPSSIDDDSQSMQKMTSGRWMAVEADDDGNGDLQLRVSIMWLAASMADLQTLVLYTLGHEQLSEMSSVYSQILRREWRVGDLSCEVLRFCRNRLYPKLRPPVTLFSQIVGRPPDTPPSQDSLD
ncbi:unnamed protein product [Larinioides sclopetarius]|uniref:PARG helical domain-containing protein n=1 Tax=Larinioides sclopetarius TaxID=280406 RepID=A0AAV1ZTP2_9ARAC